MSYEIFPQYNKTFLFPPNLEDLIPQDHPAWFIRDFIKALDLDELGFKRRISFRDGRPSFSPELVLSIWLYGYYFKIHSSRKLEKACMENIGLIWLTGMNYPDHNTIWRFFDQNKTPLNNVFKSSVRIASEMGLVGMVLHAVDGTKIQATASRKTALHRRDLEKLLKSVDEHIDKLMDEIETHEKQSIEPSFKLPEDVTAQLKNKQKFKETIQQKLKKLNEANTDHVSESDPDARMMKSSRSIEFCYNGQAVVDEQHGILVGVDITNNTNDNHMLNPMLDHVADNLGTTAKETLADGGYLSGEALQTAADNGREVLVGIGSLINRPKTPSQKAFDISLFKAHPTEDAYLCPKGGTLIFHRSKRHRARSYSVKIYRCVDHKSCPYRTQCSQDKKGRTIEIHPNREILEAHVKKHKQPGMNALYSRRMALIEKVFGEIKHNWGFKRWMYRGLESVRTQWNLLGTGYNLRKMHRACMI